MPSLLGVTALVASLTTVVRRSEEGRRLSVEVERLETEERIVGDRLALERARVDSLGSLPRLEEAARSLGLRQAQEGEFFYLSDSVLDEADEVGKEGR